jgi:hypothetical protein
VKDKKYIPGKNTDKRKTTGKNNDERKITDIDQNTRIKKIKNKTYRYTKLSTFINTKTYRYKKTSQPKRPKASILDT